MFIVYEGHTLLKFLCRNRRPVVNTSPEISVVSASVNCLLCLWVKESQLIPNLTDTHHFLNMLYLVILWHALPLGLVWCWNEIFNYFADEKAETQMVCVLCPGHTLLKRADNIQFRFLRLHSQCASTILSPLADMGTTVSLQKARTSFWKFFKKIVYHFIKGVIIWVSFVSSFLIYQPVWSFACL